MRSRHLSILVFLFASALVGSFLACRSAASAVTQAGVSIVNLATFTYTDTTGSFSGQSNTITLYVQNAPTLSVTAGGSQSVTPSMIVVDTFTLANTGNNTTSGNTATNVFTLDTAEVQTGTAAAPTLLGYTLASSTCTTAAPCTIGALNALAGMTGTGPLTVGVEYQLTNAATVGQTVITTLHAEITYAIVAAQAAATSSDTTGAETDTSVVDARLDVQSSVANPTGTTGGLQNITWTVKANNGGGNPALNLASAKAALSNLPAAAGVVLFVPLPVYSSTYLALTAAPTPVLAGQSVGATATMYYNPAACSTSPTSGWLTTGYAAAECMAVYVSGGASGAELPSLTGGSSGAGAVTTAQITLSFTTTPPSGVGAGNANTVSLVSTGAIGGVVWATGPTPILGKGVAMPTADAATASLLSGIEANAAASSGIITPGGASNSSSSQAYSSYSVLLGPLGQQAAVGAWNTSPIPGYQSGTATTMLDFTFQDYDTLAPSINSGLLPSGAPIGNVITEGPVVFIPSTIQNTGNLNDTYNLTASAQTNWTTTFQCYNAGTVTCPGGSTNSCYAGNITSIAVAANAIMNICTTFTPSTTVTTLAALPWLITATSVGSGGVTNTTNDVLYPGGAIVAFRAASTPCGAALVSGCTITYTVTLVNEAPSNGYSGASNNATITSGAITVTENGGASGNTWGTNTNGLNAIPTLTGCTGCTTTGVATSTSFTVTIPAMAPQAQWIYSYAVTLK